MESQTFVARLLEEKTFGLSAFNYTIQIFEKTELIEGILNLTLVCKATANSKSTFGGKKLSDCQFSTARCKYSEDRIHRRYFDFTLVCKATTNSKSTFGRKNFRIISFQLHDANIQKTEFIEGILILL